MAPHRARVPAVRSFPLTPAPKQTTPTKPKNQQVGAAISIGAITAVRLANVQSIQQAIGGLAGTPAAGSTCLLGFDPADMAPCRFAYVSAIVGVGVPILVGVLQLVTCDMCGCGDVLDFIATLLLGLWWIAASLALSSVAARGNLVPLPQKEWRTAVVALCWSSAGLALLAFAMHSGRVCSRCCGKGRRKRGADLEDGRGGAKAGLRQGREPSAALELGSEVRNRPYMQQQGVGASFSQGQQQAGGANALRTGLNQPSF
jgi:hypothetical protein